ncbi:TatD family hydrolase [Chryseobacterium sp. SSA4.19]|uniref:TatD family hydrolase n=1 Tax=Chryseobacterium sp. SSA4.19 TaxID=2919915 RepID=UPI001F4EBC42|nr:TatD family hydrolase [Chryseobacterium sp. SSA4.19]MCJ8155218.1 TatD family hydrolase [Chryseobacterium sp. SSA4.19]
MPNGIYNLELERLAPDFPYSIGIHPKDIGKATIEDQFRWLESNITEDCFAIGECGLDSLAETDIKIQEDVFLRQIEIANDIKKPVIIHCVRKFYEVITFKKYAEKPMIIHGFNKKQAIADALLQHDFYLSFGKALLYNLSLQHTFRSTPSDKIFLETDNDNFNIREMYETAANLKGISTEKMNEQILENLEMIKNG